MSHIIHIALPTSRVLSKLRNGGKVRISKGEGLCLIVKPEKYDSVTKTFGKGKAYTIELTPEEILANQNPPEEMEGQGLFSNIKKGFRKVGRAITPIAKQVGKEVLPVAKSLAKQGVGELAKVAPQIGATLGSTALSGLALVAGQPELVPVAESVGSKLGKAGGKALGKFGQKQLNKQIDKFDPYNQRQGSNAPPSRRPATDMFGTYNAMHQPVGIASMGNFLANMSLADLEKLVSLKRGNPVNSPLDYSGGTQVLAQYTDPVGRPPAPSYTPAPPRNARDLMNEWVRTRANRGNTPYGSEDSDTWDTESTDTWTTGYGLYAQPIGRGLRRSKKRLESASVGIHGNLLGFGIPPALMSQPYGANFQFSSRLPPAYQSLNKGSGLYA
jgi:hypothetical protein